MKVGAIQDDGTLAIKDKPTRKVYESLFKVAHARIARLFDDVEEEVPTVRREVEGVALSLNPTQISKPGDKWQKGQIQNADENPDFRPTVARGLKGRTGLYQRLARDPTFSEGKDKAWEALVSGYIEVQPMDRKDLDAAAQAAEIQANLDTLITDQIKLEWVTGAFDTGFSAWEIVDCANGFVDRAAYIRPDTVTSWVLDEQEQELLNILQETNDTQCELLAEHVWLYSHRRIGTNFDGTPQLREVAVYIEMKWMLLRLMGLSAEVFALGLRTLEKDAEINQAGSAEGIIDALQNMSAEDIPIIELAAGRSLKWHSPGSAMPDFNSLVELLDNQITKKTSTSGTHLTYNDHASRALAEVKDDETSKTGRHYGILFARSLHESIVRRIQENRYGEGARPLKTIFHLSQSVTDPDRFKRLLVYVQAGMLTWTPEDEAALRESEGLPTIAASTPAPAAQEVQDAVASLKVAMAAPANEVE